MSTPPVPRSARGEPLSSSSPCALVDLTHEFQPVRKKQAPRTLDEGGAIPPTPSREECEAWRGPTGRTGLRRPGRFPDSRQARQPRTAFPPRTPSLKRRGSDAGRVRRNQPDVQGPPGTLRYRARRLQWRDRGRFSRPSLWVPRAKRDAPGRLIPRLSLCPEISFVKAPPTVNNSGRHEDADLQSGSDHHWLPAV